MRNPEVAQAEIDRKPGGDLPGVLPKQLELRIVVAWRQEFIQLLIAGGAAEHEVCDRVVRDTPVKSESTLISVSDLGFDRSLRKLIGAAELNRMPAGSLRQHVSEGRDVVVRPPRVIARVDPAPTARESEVGNFVRKTFDTREQSRNIEALRFQVSAAERNGSLLFGTVVAPVGEGKFIEQRRIHDVGQLRNETSRGKVDISPDGGKGLGGAEKQRWQTLRPALLYI